MLRAVLATFNRKVSLLDGHLEILYFNNVRSLLVSVLFGERFQAVRYGDKLVDPGPPFAADRVLKHVVATDTPIAAVLITHAHEEHFANAAAVSRALDVPVYGSDLVAEAVRNPAKISFMRATMIGQPKGDPSAPIAGTESIAGAPRLIAVSSDGHCDGHVSFYDPERKLLLVGDSFMHEVSLHPTKR